MKSLMTSANIAWIILLIATLITWHFGENQQMSVTIVMTVMSLVFIKGVLVVLDFMELRHAPPIWRYLLICWLMLVIMIILFAYWLSLR